MLMSTLAVIGSMASDSQGSKADYRFFKTRLVNGALGAELSGIDLASTTEPGAFTEIHDALMQYQVVVFRGQNLSPKDLVRLGKQFGNLHVNAFVNPVDNHPEVMPVRSEENHEKRFTGLWHSDISWGVKPSMGSMLYAVEVPPYGGDTLFSNMYLAFSSLSKGMQKMLFGLKAEHRVDRHHSAKAEHAEIPPDGVIHPVVTTHPVTGKKVLFVNEYFTTRFDSMSEEESTPLLSYLYQHATRPDFTCRIHWEPGTLVFWDNRCTQHYATDDYPGYKRLMHRVTIEGEEPL